VTAHADLSLVGSPGFNQPRGFRPLVKDDSLEHQIRLPTVGPAGSFVTCWCLREGVRGQWRWSSGVTVRNGVDALAWYRTHLVEVDRDVVSRGNVSGVAEGGT
jgi:hypothetical protein